MTLKKMRLLVLFAIASICISAHAAQPQSVKHIEDIILPDDTIYGYYLVKCSDGREESVSAWNEKKLWCAGKGNKDNCQKKQLKIAKVVCRGA